ncbi:hypothetical protein GCM10010123_18340 [Pilimelia anulata]|uniref:Uncharacterized protein n=1 Tax=Pilimelia anulata TaxID=53371 RepID=A0A8J3B8X2_9ACTN|nr:hypothetical protein GCM10010123_18340 [Pilimelia anulata]
MQLYSLEPTDAPLQVSARPSADRRTITLPPEAVAGIRGVGTRLKPSTHHRPDMLVLTRGDMTSPIAAVSIADLPRTGEYRIGRWEALRALSPITWDRENPGRLSLAAAGRRAQPR